jgi:hypothetical protein
MKYFKSYFTEQVKTKPIKIYCTENDIEYKITGSSLGLNFSEQFFTMLSSLKINKEEFFERLQESLRFRLVPTITICLIIDNINKILNEMTKEHKSLEIE